MFFSLFYFSFHDILINSLIYNVKARFYVGILDACVADYMKSISNERTLAKNCIQTHAETIINVF